MCVSLYDGYVTTLSYLLHVRYSCPWWPWVFFMGFGTSRSIAEMVYLHTTGMAITFMFNQILNTIARLQRLELNPEGIH